MPDTKLRPKSTLKSKDKSSKQRFGHVNATNHNLNITFVKLVTQCKRSKTNLKFELLRFFLGFKPKNIGFSSTPRSVESDNKQTVITTTKNIMKESAQRRRKHCAGCSMAEPKFFVRLQTPLPGAQDGQKLISWRWSLPLPTNSV